MVGELLKSSHVGALIQDLALNYVVSSKELAMGSYYFQICHRSSAFSILAIGNLASTEEKKSPLALASSL